MSAVVRETACLDEQAAPSFRRDEGHLSASNFGLLFIIRNMPLFGFLIYNCIFAEYNSKITLTHIFF